MDGGRPRAAARSKSAMLSISVFPEHFFLFIHKHIINLFQLCGVSLDDLFAKSGQIVGSCCLSLKLSFLSNFKLSAESGYLQIHKLGGFQVRFWLSFQPSLLNSVWMRS